MNLVSFSPTFKLNISSTNVGIRTRFDAMQNVVNQRKTLFQGGDVWNTRLLHLLLHQRRSWTALFCVLGENKKSRFSLKIRILRCFAFLCCGATGNRTRDTRIFSPLLYQLSYGTSLVLCKPFRNCGAKIERYFEFPKLHPKKIKKSSLTPPKPQNYSVLSTLCDALPSIFFIPFALLFVCLFVCLFSFSYICNEPMCFECICGGDFGSDLRNLNSWRLWNR